METRIMAADALSEISDTLAKKVVDRQYELQPDICGKYNASLKKISIRDVKYHLSFLVESIRAEEPEIFKGYVRWVKVLFKNLNFSDAAMQKTLECMQTEIEENLIEEAVEVCRDYIQAGLEVMREQVENPSDDLRKKNPHLKLAENYLSALLDKDKRRATDLILNAVENGVSVKDIYLHVFEKTQKEVGRLWLTNRLTVAQEHYCSAVTQMIMSQLYDHFFTDERSGRRFVGCSVHGELHEIGIRMLADFFEMEGWDSIYLGANTPDSAVVKTLEEEKTDILGISIAMPFHFAQLENLVSTIRSSETGKAVKILVGGNLINTYPDLLKKLDVDGFAFNAKEAINLANSFDSIGA